MTFSIKSRRKYSVTVERTETINGELYTLHHFIPGGFYWVLNNMFDVAADHPTFLSGIHKRPVTGVSTIARLIRGLARHRSKPPS